MKSKQLTQSLNNYSQWQQNKLYEGHMSRLKKIHQSLIKKNKKSQIIIRKVSSRVDKPSIKKHKTQPPEVSDRNLHMAIPLVPDEQGKLISSTLYSKNMSLREKQHLLENYLLGRRIISTQSVFNAKELKKQFRMHRKISKNMSKSLRSKSSLISSREQQYSSFLKETKRDTSVGFGKIAFNFKINKLMLIKGQFDRSQKIIYTIKISYSKTKIQIKPLSYEELIGNQHSFKLKKSHLQKASNALFQICCFRQNTELLVGKFNLDLNQFMEDKKDEEEEERREKEKQKIVIKNMLKGNTPIGSISIKGGIKQSFS